MFIKLSQVLLVGTAFLCSTLTNVAIAQTTLRQTNTTVSNKNITRIVSPKDFSKIKTPTQSKSQAIGEYYNGCIDGAKKIAFDNPYFQVIRPQNKRFYGHPNLITFIENLATNANKNDLPILLIGDMGMARGGPFLRGHNSHQSGLDVDIWYRMVDKRLPEKQLKSPYAINIVSDNWYETNKNYNNDIYTLIKLAANDEQVERIFVNAAIKKQLCLDSHDNKEWLSKVRPWWGHNAHMHVRLSCPKDSPLCVKQQAIKKDHGCGEEIDSWINDIKNPKKKKSSPPPRKEIKVSDECKRVLLSTD